MPTDLLGTLSWHELPHLIFLLALIATFWLVIRQNRKDLLDLEAELASGRAEF